MNDTNTFPPLLRPSCEELIARADAIGTMKQFNRMFLADDNRQTDPAKWLNHCHHVKEQLAIKHCPAHEVNP